jgi:hypothetical protein
VTFPVAEALLEAVALLEAELSVATDVALLVAESVVVPMAVAVPVAVSGFSCILGSYSLPMQVLWEEDTAIVPQSPAHSAHKNTA